MSRYRKIDPRIWNDAKFRALSDGGKLVFFMLLTHPNMTSLGGMRATIPGLAEELGWKVEAFREAFREALQKGMAEHDPKACMVALPKFLKYNPPESPNVVKAWVGSLDLLPECELKIRVVARAKDFAKGMSKGFHEALPEAFVKAMPYQEQEQEQEQEQLKTSPTPPQAEGGYVRVPSWMKELPQDVIEAGGDIHGLWPAPENGDLQPGARELTPVPKSSRPELCRRLLEIKRQGGDLEVCRAIAKRAVKEWRDGKWIKASQHFFGKAKDAPWQAYYQAHITNQAARVLPLQPATA